MRSILSLLVGLVLVASSTTSAQEKFTDSHKRAIGSFDAIRYLLGKFQLSTKYLDYSSRKCTDMDFSTHVIAGSVIPSLQNRLVEQPEAEFVGWFESCTAIFARVKFSSVSIANEDGLSPDLRNFLGAENYEWARSYIQNYGEDASDALIANLDWDIIPRDRQASIVKHWLEAIWVGPEFVIQELRIIGPESELVGEPQTLDDLVEILISQEIKPIDNSEVEDESIEKPLELRPKVKHAFIAFSVQILTLPELTIH